MKPTPRAAQRPHPFCPLCNQDAACPFHTAQNAKELGSAFFETLRRRGSMALVDFLTWALANIEEMIPDVVLDKLGELDRENVEDEFAQLLDLEGFESDDLRRLAAVALASALLVEQQEQKDDDGPNDLPQERRRAHDHNR